MGAFGRTLVVFALLVSVPAAAAIDPLNEPVCVDGTTTCAGVGTCVGLACAPPGCEPAFDCRSEVGPDNLACATNATIEGRTCAIHVGAGAGRAPVGSAEAAVSVSNGSARSNELENTWFAPGAEAHLDLLGFDLGHVFVYAYRSDVLTEGPRGGPYGRIEPSDNHTWTQIGVVAGHHGGPFYGEDVVVAIELLDLMPEGCYVRSASGVAPDVTCPRAPVYPPLMALP